jgi:hypothetical protein
LDLLEEILVGVLCHLAALISVEEDVVNIERGSNKGLLVGGRDGLGSIVCTKRLNSPEALTDGADVKVDLDLVVLESNQRKGKARVAAEPEEKGNVEGGLRKGLAGSTDLVGSTSGGTGARDISEIGVSDVGKLGGVTNHLEVSTLLLRRHGELVPDVHPVTVLAVNALATNLDLNLGDELLTNEVQPTGIDTAVVQALVNLRESNLEVSAVSKVTVTGDCAGYTAAEIGLAREGLLNRFHCEVGMASVRHLPESNLGSSSKEHVLCAIGDELHKSTSHFGIFSL